MTAVSQARAKPYRANEDHEFNFTVCAEYLVWCETLFRAITLTSKHESAPLDSIDSLASLGEYLTEQAGGVVEGFKQKAKAHAGELEAAERARIAEGCAHAR